MRFMDGLVNLVANLGTGRDKAASSRHVAQYLNDGEITAAYDGSALARKIVTIPANDAVRNWREWQADGTDITAIEAEEKRLGLRGIIRANLTRSRLWGGSAIYIDTGSDAALPLNLRAIRKGSIRSLTVLTRRQITPGDADMDIAGGRYGKPEWYELANGQGSVTRIHHTRLAVFNGPERADADQVQDGWPGSSVLNTTLETIRDTDSAFANVLSLMFEAKVDVVKIPEFTANLSGPMAQEYERTMLSRWRLAMAGKGINGALMIDAAEDYQQKSANFGNLDSLLDRFQNRVASAADIPVTRLFNTSPGGMNATGESDTANYHAKIAAMQSLDMEPAMATLDEALIRSALGDRPDDVFYNWRPLGTPSAKERAEVGKLIADTFAAVRAMDVDIPDAALAKAVVNALTEAGAAPGLEAAVMEFAGLAGDFDESEPPADPIEETDA